MTRTLLLGLALVALLASSCASSHSTTRVRQAGADQDVSRSQPAARVALAPEFRLFYDALQDYGDWILIEPYGYVFRPRINYLTWRPYEDGYWVPTDVYGWVWVSAEPFGWATYHYGRWLYDDYQRWVWVPGADWGPAWVTWQLADDYVGWAPLTVRGSASPPAAGAFNYAPIGQLAATDLKGRVLHANELPERMGDLERIDNVVVRGGVTINRGPRFDLVERHTGPLTRVHVEDAISPVDAEVLRRQLGPGGAPDPTSSIVERTRRAAEEGAQQAREQADAAARPGTVKVVRPLPEPQDGKPRRLPVGRHAPSDSTRN